MFSSPVTGGMPSPMFSYEIRDGKVYFANQRLVDARWLEFIDLGQGYGKDSQHVYFMGQIMENVHTFSFRVMDNSYAKDHQYVFQHGRIVANLQSQHFHPSVHLDSTSATVMPTASSIHTTNGAASPPPYEIRDFKVFFANQLVPHARWIDFTELGQGYGKDSHHVFFMGQLIPGAHSFSFEVLSKGYAKDKNYVFQSGRIIHGVNPLGFQN